MPANSRSSLVRPITLLAGAMDACTGLLLIFAPRLTCRLMGLSAIPDVDFLPFVGAFVAAVGFSYFWGLRPGRLRATWELTALIRSVIGTFVSVSIVSGKLAPGWLPVAATDLGLALLQFGFLRKGWVRDA